MTSGNKISMDKKYRTRDGREVRLLCIDGPDSNSPVIGIVGCQIVTWRINGRWGSLTQASDLFEVVPDVVRWANVYPDGNVPNIHPSRDIANHFAKPNRIALLKITTKNNGVNGAEDVSVEVLKVGER